MTYKGQLYGKFGRRYVPLDVTAEDADEMVDKLTAERDRLREMLREMTAEYSRLHLNDHQWIGNPFECPRCRLIERAENLVQEASDA